MKYLVAFLKLIRWPNLLIIALAQWLFYFSVADSQLLPGSEQVPAQQAPQFYLLMLASLLIAAAGYIINDYFDFDIDLVNRPDRVLVDKFIRRRWAMAFHILLSVAGLAVSYSVALQAGNKWILIGNAICVLMLVLYSSTFKKKLLTGNVMVSLLIAWSILVVYLFAGGRMPDYRGFSSTLAAFNLSRLYLLAMTYSGFAFAITLVREVIKDMEDMLGDARYQCRTIPIVWGIPAAKAFCGVWMIVIMASIAVAAVFSLQTGWWAAAIFLAVAVLLPMAHLMKRLRSAVSAGDYRKLSHQIKWIMLSGILSMALFKLLP